MKKTMKKKIMGSLGLEGIHNILYIQNLSALF